MKKFGYSFLFAFGLLLAFGWQSSSEAQQQRRGKYREVPVTYGILSVKTSPESYPVFVNGRQAFMSGVDSPREEQLPPGTYSVEVRFPNRTWTKEIAVNATKRSCVCLSYTERTIRRVCPYEVRVDAPDAVTDGDLVTFSAGVGYGGTSPLNYRWTVTPDTARITSGQGTPSITVDTTGLGGQSVVGRLEVDDGSGDPNCQQANQATVPVRPIEKLPPPPFKFDSFTMIAFDDVKARLDNYAIELQNRPDVMGYVIVYGRTVQEANRLGTRTLDYLTRNRKIDARRVTIVNGGRRERGAYELWLVPPGANPPMPTPAR